MKKILFALMMMASLISNSQENCKPSPHLYFGGGIGYGTSEAAEGFVLNTNIGIATRIVGVDGSVLTYPSPSSPTIFAAHLTKPFFSGNVKTTLGFGYAYTLITVDDPKQNSRGWAAYLEAAWLLPSDYATIYFRGSVTGTHFIFTAGMQGIFKKN